jgi:REP element-mobilizing transposase RayT
VNRERKSIRLSNWDYSSEGIYFITICCFENKMFFGEIIDKKMILNELGKMASLFWKKIHEHFSHVYPDEYVIMPNHIHGILILDYSGVRTRHGVSLQSNIGDDVGPCHGMAHQGNGINKFSKPVKNSVSVIVNQYKSTLKRWCNKNGYVSFQWQSRFYDKIIWDENSVDEVRCYIRDNPRNWEKDELNK